ncbi:MAG: SYNERG-CTERM sorting domain-containing protein [Fretibacterium sp.]|nr:SYNERG-CTERM sorting domain-containing protein [Fretibacterium sp.]
MTVSSAKLVVNGVSHIGIVILHYDAALQMLPTPSKVVVTGAPKGSGAPGGVAPDSSGSYATTLTIKPAKLMVNGVLYEGTVTLCYDVTLPILPAPSQVTIVTGSRDTPGGGGTSADIEPQPAPMDAVSVDAIDWKLTQGESDKKALIPVTIRTILHIAGTPIYVRAQGVGFVGGIIATIESYASRGDVKAEKKDHTIILEGKTYNPARAAITGIWYKTAEDSAEREVALPDNGIKLSDMSQIGGSDGGSDNGGGGGGGCNAGSGAIAMFALLAFALRRKKV